jgi:protease IV
MRRLIVGFLAAVGALVLLLVAAVGGGLLWLKPSVPKLPGRIVLEVDLTGGLADAPSDNPLLRILSGSETTMRDFLEALDIAAKDARVKGLVARLGGDDLGIAETQQVRDAIAAFRASGKFAVAFADSFGEFGPGTRPYYLATAFDQIWLQPLGSVGLTGLYSDVPFFRATLDLLGIVPQFDHREQFKTAANSLTETGMTPAHREEVEGLIASLGGQIVAGIAAGRKLAPAAVRAAIDRGPLLDREALRAGLVDRLGYRDEAVAAARRRAGDGARLVRLASYLDAAGPPPGGPRIALIYGSGLIVRGRGSGTPLSGAAEMPADDVVRAFRDAARDPKVRAILFRINSPGGSVVAAETIWRAVVEAQRQGKPVIVSMGDVAGSGGYYVAAPAEKIVAEPATLTGSIGVLAGKLVVSGLLQKLGITTDSAQLGANAAMFSATQGFSAAGQARLEAFLDADYEGFKAHVATGRHLSAGAVEAAAKGRVWTGEEAKALGLVDALGGYRTALSLARQAAKIPANAPVDLAVYPRPRGPLEFVYDRLTGRRPDGTAGSGAFGRAIAAVEPLFGRLDALYFDGRILALMPSSTLPIR